MISIVFAGRLGNLLFQIAATITYAMESGHTFSFVFDKEWNTIFSDLFPYRVDTYDEVTKTLDESSVNNLTAESSDKILLTGFYQNYKIFDKWRTTILNITGLSRRRTEVLSSRTWFKKDKTNVSIHFRRGDYTELRCYHLLLTEFYYKNAMLNMLSRFSNIRFICFCEPGSREDIVKMIQSLQTLSDSLGYHSEFVIFDENLSDWEEFFVMSGCDHHIIANSTFSWWAAYLNPSQNKVVCYPDEWYNHQLYYLSTAGLEYPGWTKIKAWNPAEKKCGCF
jgi:hypothetical protein